MHRRRSRHHGHDRRCSRDGRGHDGGQVEDFRGFVNCPLLLAWCPLQSAIKNNSLVGIQRVLFLWCRLSRFARTGSRCLHPYFGHSKFTASFYRLIHNIVPLVELWLGTALRDASRTACVNIFCGLCGCILHKHLHHHGSGTGLEPEPAKPS